jgi:RNA ligase (TIGR02306 family)
MSSLIVKVRQINEVLAHTNANSLELAVVDGWQCVIKKGSFVKGDKVVYFPPDTVLPVFESDTMGVTGYLKNQRVRTIKLRGQMSYGLLVKPKNPNWEIDQDVATEYGATKWVPPEPDEAGLMPRTGGKKFGKYSGTLPDHPFFWKYTDTEHLRNFTSVIPDGTEVVMTEKLHGSSVRTAITIEENGERLLHVGSRNHRKRFPFTTVVSPSDELKNGNLWQRVKFYWQYACNGFQRKVTHVDNPNLVERDWWWHPTKSTDVVNLMNHVLDLGHRQVIVYGETYGTGVQTLDYGVKDRLAFAAYEILIDGNFVDYDRYAELCQKFNIPTCPLLYRGPYSFAIAEQYCKGNSTLTGANHIREGIVVKPVKVFKHPSVGRVNFKVINPDYLLAREDGKIVEVPG